MGGKLRRQRATSLWDDFKSKPIPAEPASDVANSQLQEQLMGGLAEAQDTPVLARASATHGQSYGYEAEDEFQREGDEADREAAAEELADMFEIVPNDYEGPRKPNTVTEAEYERVCILYSDIRRENTSIMFGGDYDDDEDYLAFQAAVMNDIAKILTTETGREVLEELAYESKNDVYIESGNTIDTQWDPHGDVADVINGNGLEATVTYPADQDVDLHELSDDDHYETSDYRDMPSDVVLYHELLHAQGIANGEIDGHTDLHGHMIFPQVDGTEALGPHDVGVMEEEYETIGLGDYADEEHSENAYRKQRAAVTGEEYIDRDDYNGSKK